MRQDRIIIIGAGFAGVATAWWLVQKGFKDITILEKEELPGMNASGLNAAFARHFTFELYTTRLAIEGVNFLRNPPAHWESRNLIDNRGALFLFSENDRKMIEGSAKECSGLLNVRIISRAEASKFVPILEDALFDGAAWVPGDGVIDIHAYLWSFIKDVKHAGAKLFTNQEVKKISTGKNQSFIIQTNNQEFDANIVVNAAGAWVSKTGEMAGASPVRFRTLRRHLFNTIAYDWIDKNWPFVWDSTNNYYFRPESGGLLLSVCDEEPVPPDTKTLNPSVAEELALKLARFCPRLKDIEIAKEWCGIRTFTEDEKFLIEWDKKRKGFFWVAGLGGHGVTTAAAVGRIAAEAITSAV